MTLKACIMTLACLFAAAVQAQQALPDSTAPVALEPMKIEAETLKRLPVRGVEAMVGLMPGVVTLDGNLHMRGGRAEEIGYTVNSMNVNRPMDGSFSLPLIHNAIEAISVYSGGYSAGQSGRLSGLVEIKTKTGGDRLKLTGEIISDDFWKVKGDDGGLRVLGLDDTYSYGYNDYTLTLGGPVPGVKGLRFFTAGQVWNRASEATRFEGFQQDSLRLVQTWYRRDASTETDTLEYYADIPPGRIPGLFRKGWLLNSRLSCNWNGLAVELGFDYSHEEVNTQPVLPADISPVGGTRYEEFRDCRNVTWRLSHEPLSWLSYSLSGGRYHRSYEGRDPVWGDDLEKWGNPELNPALFDSSLPRSFDIPVDDTWRIPFPGTPSQTYSKSSETRWQYNADVEARISHQHLLRLGAYYHEETVRHYSLTARRLYDMLQQAALHPDLYTEYDVYSYLNLIMIGYDWHGNEIEDDQETETLLEGLEQPLTINVRNKPLKPQQLSFYLEDEISLKDLHLNAGVRYDRFANGWWSLNDITLLTQAPGGVLSSEDIGPEKVYHYWSPRLTVTVPLSKSWTFSAHVGQYVQPPNASDLWARSGYTQYMSQLFRSSYLRPVPNPNILAQRSWLKQVSLDFQPAALLRISAEIFDKAVAGIPGFSEVIPQAGAAYAPPTLIVDDLESNVTGGTIDVKVRVGASSWLNVSYTGQTVLMQPNLLDTHRDISETPDPPRLIKLFTADHDINHSLKAQLHLQSGADAGFSCRGVYPLANVNLDAAFSAQSGRPYTKIGVDDALSEVYGYHNPKPLGEWNGSRLLWNWQVDVRLGKFFAVGPVNMEAYLWVINLFDCKAALDAFPQTGRPDTDGWLLTDEGKKKIADKGEEYAKWYNADLTGCGTFGWQPPRQLRAGLRFEL